MEPEITREEAYASAKKHAKIGLISCIVGIAVTSLTYFSAAAGGTYTVLYGAIIWGAYEGIVKGLIPLLKLQKEDGNMHAFKNTLLAGIVTIVALVGVSLGAYWYANENYVDAIMEEQVFQSEVYGIKITIPEGMSEMEVTEYAETDSTYQYVTLETFDNKYSYSFEALKDIFAGKDTLDNDEMIDILFTSMTYDYDYDNFEMDDPEIVEVDGLNMIQFVGERLDKKAFMVQFGLINGNNIYRHDLFISEEAVKTKEEAIQKTKDFVNKVAKYSIVN